MKRISLYVLLICSITILLFSACKSKTSNKNDESKDPPQELIKIEGGIEQIISLLDKEGKIKEEGSSSSQSQQSDGSGGGDSKQEDSSSNGSSENSSDNEQKNDSSDSSDSNSQPTSVWDEADKVIKEIHKNWNDYHPLAVKDGSASDIVDGFDSDLNTLSNSVANKNLMSTLDNANNLYKYIPEFLDNYDVQTININKLKFYTRDVMYKSRFDKWDLAQISLKQCTQTVDLISTEFRDKKFESIDKLKYSVKNLSKVTIEEQKSLTQIKGNLIIENINALEKEIENDKKKEEEENK